jgi:Ca2+ transporting ATPase
LIGVLGIKDILRQEVPGAVMDCRNAGIKVRMVTGDNKLTATAIAKECNIV